MRPAYRLTPDRLVVLGAILTAAIYCRDLQYDFVLDDQPLILLNETFTSWRNWKLLFTTHISSAGNTAMLYPGSIAVHYRPVYMLWLMATSKLSGMSTPWLHLASLLLHVVVVFLVYWLARKISKDRWASAVAALLFAFHPIHVESVAYISASTDILVTFFALISLLCYLRFREESGAILFWLLSILLAALAMLSKETAAMLPWILVAYETFPRDSRSESPLWKRWLWTLPFFGVVAAYAAVRALLFGPTKWPASADETLHALASVPLVFLLYLKNLLCPLQLSFFYPVDWVSQWTTARAALLALLAGAGIWLWRRQSDAFSVRTPLVWTTIFLIPALATVFLFAKDDWVHDRHMYLASVPFCMLLAAFLVRAALPRWASSAASAMVSTVFLAITFLEVPRFKDELTLYQSAMNVAPESINLHRYYAWGLLDYGRVEESLGEFRKTISLTPDSANAHEEYAAALLRTGREDDAAVEFQKVLQFTPSPTPFRAFVLYRLANIQLKRGQLSGATDHLREATQIDPQQLNYHAALAVALREQGLTQEAEQAVQREAALRSELLHKRAGLGDPASRP